MCNVPFADEIFADGTLSGEEWEEPFESRVWRKNYLLNLKGKEIQQPSLTNSPDFSMLDHPKIANQTTRLITVLFNKLAQPEALHCLTL